MSSQSLVSKRRRSFPKHAFPWCCQKWRNTWNNVVVRYLCSCFVLDSLANMHVFMVFALKFFFKFYLSISYRKNMQRSMLTGTIENKSMWRKRQRHYTANSFISIVKQQERERDREWCFTHGHTNIRMSWEKKKKKGGGGVAVTFSHINDWFCQQKKKVSYSVTTALLNAWINRGLLPLIVVLPCHGLFPFSLWFCTTAILS